MDKFAIDIISKNKGMSLDVFTSICEYGTNEEVNNVLTYIKDKFILSNNMLLSACKNKDKRVVMTILNLQTKYGKLNMNLLSDHIICLNDMTLIKHANVIFTDKNIKYINDDKILRYAIKQIDDKQFEDNYLYKLCCEKGFVDMLEYLDKKCKIDHHMFNDYPIKISVVNNHMQVFAYLLKTTNYIKIDVIYDLICMYNRLSMFKTIIRKYRDILPKKYFEIACSYGSYTIVLYILSLHGVIGKIDYKKEHIKQIVYKSGSMELYNYLYQ